MIINNSFNGKLNLDVQPYRIAGGDYVDALNITRDSPGAGQDIVVTNVIGNTIISYSLPEGDNKVIGRFPDRIRNRVYIAIWNSNDFDLWIYYDADTNQMVKLIENTIDTDGDVLAFDPSYRINHIDLIYNDIQGDLLFYTDGNLTPRKFNVSHILNGDYTSIKTPFIEVAKAPFLDPPTCVYGSDSTRNSNSLRRTLFQFTIRPVYDDFEKGVLFSFSKIALPIGFYGSDNDIDNTKNNFITVTLPTGDENVIALEVGVRQSLGAAWSDVVLVAHLDKEQLAIPDNSTYQLLFYNDTIYPTITDGVQYLDEVQSIPLFFWVPQLAFAQALANGNVPVYGAIQEGYNNYPINELQITMTAENVTNSPPDADPPSLTYVISPDQWIFTVDGSVPVGTRYRIIAVVPGMGSQIFADYTSIMGDTTSDVAEGLRNYIIAHFAGYAGAITFNSFIVSPPTPGFSVISIFVDAGGGGGGMTISTEKTWMDDCPYAFGLVYFDDQGRDMPGVITFSNPVDSDNDFLVTTPSISFDSTTRQTPVISATINHLPPAGAKKYAWVRRRLQYSNWVEYETCDFQEEGGFYYFCLANIDLYKVNNTNFIYGSAPITESGNQRIKIKAGIMSGDYDGTVWNQDYQILGLETRTLTGGSSPDDDRLFIKVQVPTTPPSPSYEVNMLVMVYTPSVNPSNAADSVYYEWGESYDTYTLDDVLYHRGMTQDQTDSQPAEFTWDEGDVYYHARGMYDEIRVDPITHTDTLSIIDENFSDFFESKVNDNGRAQAIEVNATQVYDPVLYRFGGAYQNSTTVNNNPDFYFENFDQADRSFGDIRKFYVRDRYLYVFQKFKVGIIPVLLQIIRDTAGNPLEANSEELLNKINYPYNEDIGIGDIPESFASDKSAMYGGDDFKGVVWRLSQDGITKLSVLYDCNSFFVSNLRAYRKSLNNGFAASGQTYTGDPSVNGVFDASTNKYLIALEEINRYDESGNLIFHQDPYTLSFNEVRSTSEGFESKLSFFPEAMVALDTLLITFKNGSSWKHTEDVTYCNYYGVQYGAYITAVFNDSSLQKKSWMSVTELADDLWECPLIFTNVTSYGTQRQETKLIPQNFKRLENDWHASFLRDMNSMGGVINGNRIKGNYMVIKFLKHNATNLIYINGASVMFKDSPLTNK